MKIKINLIYRYSLLLMLILGLIMFFVVGLFFYHNIYQTITASVVILELQRETVIAQTLDITNWNRIREFLKKRDELKLLNLDQLRNPFLDY